MNPKIFGVGFHKTGTTTLEVVLKKLGFSVLGPQKQFVSVCNLLIFSFTTLNIEV